LLKNVSVSCPTLFKAVKLNECGYPTSSVLVWLQTFSPGSLTHFSANGLGHQQMKGTTLNSQTKDRHHHDVNQSSFVSFKQSVQ